MTSPSGGGALQLPDAVFARGVATVNRIKVTTQAMRTAAGSITPRREILEYAEKLANMRDILAGVVAVTSIVQYAKTLVNDANYEIITELNQTITNVGAVTAWIIANFPADGSSNLQFARFNADNSGRIEYTTFTAAQLAEFRTALDALLASID